MYLINCCDFHLWIQNNLSVSDEYNEIKFVTIAASVLARCNIQVSVDVLRSELNNEMLNFLFM